MSPFLVARAVVAPFNPCKNIDPDSWGWIFSGCWLINSSVIAELVGGAVLALMVGVMFTSLRQEKQPAFLSWLVK